MTKDTLIAKVVIPGLSAAIVGLFGWVWDTNTQLSALEIKLKHAQEAVDKMEANNTKIAVIDKDVEHINASLKEIKGLIIKLGGQ